jgi:hypothetical protein
MLSQAYIPQLLQNGVLSNFIVHQTIIRQVTQNATLRALRRITSGLTVIRPRSRVERQKVPHADKERTRSISHLKVIGWSESSNYKQTGGM